MNLPLENLPAGSRWKKCSTKAAHGVQECWWGGQLGNEGKYLKGG